jgi:aminoglycoside phosphotransferase (APT) family kinase protein
VAEPRHGQIDLIDPITPETVSSALQTVAGLTVPPGELRLERRHWRWVARLPDQVLVFIPDSATAVERLGREGRLLQLLASRVSFGVPRVDDTGPSLQVRTIVPGEQVGGEGRERAFADLPQGMRLADDLGRALGELHGALTKEQAEEIGLAYADPLPDAEALRVRLVGKLSDPLFAAVFTRVLELYRETEPPSADIVVTHGDVWGGNMAVDLETGALNGLFDFDDAALADRHVDFMYVHSFGDQFARRALAAYARETGQELSWQRTAVYHAAAAFAALADMRGKGEDYLLQRELDWVSDVCRGPIRRMTLSCTGT